MSASADLTNASIYLYNVKRILYVKQAFIGINHVFCLTQLWLVYVKQYTGSRQENLQIISFKHWFCTNILEDS